MKHQYRVTLEHLLDKQGQAVTERQPLQFETACHDDIAAIVEKLKNRSDFPADSVESFAVGLKLLGEVLVEQRHHPIFADFFPHFKQFMKTLKEEKAKPELQRI